MVFLLFFLIIFFFYLYSIMPGQNAQKKSNFLYGQNFARCGLYDNGTEQPENSLPAFRFALQANYGIELQIQLTKDLVPVVFAEDHLLRLTGVDQKISDLTWNELQNHSILNTKEPIPTLEEVLLLINGSVPILLDLHSDCNPTKLLQSALEVVTDYQGAFGIESDQSSILQTLRIQYPLIPRGLRAGTFSVSLLEGFTHRFLLSNIRTRPDFVVYPYQKGKSIPLSLCKTFFQVTNVAYTVRSMEDYSSLHRNFDSVIFENITPSPRLKKERKIRSTIKPPVVARPADQMKPRPSSTNHLK